LIVAGIDTLDERREVLTAKRHVLASSSEERERGKGERR